ncbi:MAG: hypothetical protein HC878_00295 [Leptolyngbyaceae cyanobacterium SL_5_14]|nr:hypothetical protein [Leptolyngbyaceae cyanobacterium SL_5_14]
MTKYRATPLGVTLTETLVGIFMIGLLAAIAIPTMLNILERNQIYLEASYTMGILKNEIEEYRLKNNKYPENTIRNIAPEGLPSFPVNGELLYDYDNHGSYVRLVCLGINRQKETPNDTQIGKIGTINRYGDDLLMYLWIENSAR